MKKHISMLLCAAVLTTAITGCASDEIGSSGNAPAAGSASTDTSAPEQTSSADPSAAVTTAATTTTDDIRSDIPETTNSANSSESVPPPVVVTSAPQRPEQAPVTEEPLTEESDEVYIPLTADDVLMEIITDGDITTDTEYFRVEFTYIGDADCWYGFGCDYSLRKWTDDGWQDVQFSDNAAWEALGYLISKENPKNSIGVSLRDDFYAEPLTAGTYLLVKKLCDGVVFEETFEIKGAEDGTVIESESGTLTLVINEIAEGKLSCSLPWAYPAVYEVMCNTTEYNDFCVGDTIEVEYAPMYKLEEFLFRVQPVSISMSDFELQPGADYKPVIYLYPDEVIEVSVKLDYNGTLTVTEPEYGSGWNVTAHPDGRIFAAGKEYPYLFWEGERAYALDSSKGFCVSGEDTEDFLREKLGYLGLNENETADFMEFWLPHMRGNNYNIIRFHGEDYTENAELDISPSPDTLIRVYMTFEASEEYVDIAPQHLEAAPARSGFTVVEWGGGIS